MRRTIWSSLLLLLAGLATLPVVPTGDQALVQGLVEVGGAAVLWCGLRPRRDLDRPGWWLIAAGLSLLALSDLLTAVDGFPADLDVSLIAVGYVVLAAGAARVVLRDRFLPTQSRGWTETCVLGLGALAPLLTYLVLPVATGHGEVSGRVGVVVYAVFAFVAVIMLARMVVFDGSVSFSVGCLGLCLLCSVAGATWSALHGGSGLVSVDPVVRILWALTFLLAAAGVSHRSLRGTGRGHDGPPATPTTTRRVGVLAAGLVLPPLSMLVDLALGGHAFLWVQAGLAMAVSVLAAWRATVLASQLAASKARLEQVARSDELTGLPNRRGWQHDLAAACAEAARTDGRLGVAVIAVDDFTAFNLAQGPASGDRFLRRLAADWSAALREGEVLARFGGVQFAILLPGLDLAATHRRVELLRRLVPAPQTASAGVSVLDLHHDGDRALLEADSALYLALCRGGDRTVVADASSDVLPGPLRDLQTAVQPIVRLDDTATVAVECLSRFPHTTAIEAVFADAHQKGFGDLLEVAAIQRVLAVPDRPPGLEVYVNVSERAARSARFWTELPQDLTGVVVELVEQRDGLSDDEVGEVFDRFRARGARVALDDVGSSSTDFARIAALGPDVAKIDRSLVAGCDASPSQAAVLRMLVGFALSHGAEVVVEGIETAGELEVARQVGATYAQGYLLGRPGTPWPGSAAQRPPATRNVVPVT